ncbi:MAG: aminotransferase class III-fold pyridoxal phosphate-dependent enzyme [Alphaproteobacteria bacterium]
MTGLLTDAQRRNLAAIREREDAAFAAGVPKSLALRKEAAQTMPCGVPMSWMAGLQRLPPVFIDHGAGAHFTDIDGNTYLDMNQADLAACLGFAPPAITREVSKRLEKGVSFLQPTEDAAAAGKALATWGVVPYWQFSGSASGANTEVMRIARFATGRTKMVMFDGRYHGHVDEFMADGYGDDNATMGLHPDASGEIRVVEFNNLDALKEALAPGDVACVMAEPLLTNVGIIFPDDGFWPAARQMIRDAGALFAADESHTYSMGFGGVSRQWSLEPDFQVLGKGLGSGIPFAVYGMTEPLKDLLENNLHSNAGSTGIAIGGTTYANAIAVTAAHVAATECLTEQAYDYLEILGTRLGEGLQGLFNKHSLSWRAPHIAGRSGYVLQETLHRTAPDGERSLDPLFADTRRVYCTNRGVWDALLTAGPSCSFAHAPEDVDRYLQVIDEFLGEMTA